MTTHCQVGEKAHLWINASDHWVFDGPIDVQVKKNNGTAGSIHLFKKTGALCSSANCGLGSRDFLFLGNSSTLSVTGFDSNYTCPGFGFGTVSGYFRRANHPGMVCGTFVDSTVWHDEGSVSYRSNSGKNYSRLGFLKDFPQYWGNKYSESDFSTDWNLSVSKSGSEVLSKNYPDEPTYTVRCGDKCPPGTTWNEKCKDCICDDMAAIKAGLKGATAIARSIGR